MNKNIIKLFAVLMMIFMIGAVLVACAGPKGDQGLPGEPGEKGDVGPQGEPGKDGNSPYIGENGNWWINGADTGIKAKAEDLRDCENHQWDKYVITVQEHAYNAQTGEATIGVIFKGCVDCGDGYFFEIDHEYDAVVTAPTCTDKGYTTHTCECGHSYVDTYVDALGHNVVADFDADNIHSSWVLAEPEEGAHPCLSEPVYTTNCTRCAEEMFATGKAPGHTGEWKKAHNDTDLCDCEWEPVYVKECTVCLEVFDRKTGEAEGHSYNAWVVAKNPTTTEAGSLVKKCSKCICCDEFKTLPALVEGAEGYVVTTKDAECETAGYTAYTYTIDGKSFEFKVEIPAKGHTYNDKSEYAITILPTKEAVGSVVVECVDCNHTETIELPALVSTEYTLIPGDCNTFDRYEYKVLVNGQDVGIGFEIEGRYNHVDYDATMELHKVEGENAFYFVYKCPECGDWVVYEAEQKN